MGGCAEVAPPTAPRLPGQCLEGSRVNSKDAMEQISKLLDEYYNNEMRELAVLARISQVVGHYEGGKK